MTPERELLRAAARRFAAENFEVDDLRRARADTEGPGYSLELWRQMAELGWVGMVFAGEHGGEGLGYAELGVVLEELGARLALTPFLATVVVAGTAIAEAGTEAQRGELLRRIARGELLIGCALQEGPRFDPAAVETVATRRDGGYVLRGEKVLVLDPDAELLLVAARIDHEPRPAAHASLFLVPSSHPGVAITPGILVDSRRAATVVLTDVAVGREAQLGGEEGERFGVERVLSVAKICLAAEMLGGIRAAFDLTLGYLKEREQFGVKIGSFQALQHRAARWLCEVELSRAISAHALEAIDERAEDLDSIACVCKGRVAETFLHSGEEGIQMHGGVGMTDEHDIGFFLKRARVAQQLFGDSTYQRQRYAELRGY